jgi:TPR repeat protein
MIRGLPPEATLSAGRQSGGGAWMVKGEHVPGLILTLGQAASGDYPVEVYILESGDGPQARRNFVLRVAPSDRASVAVPVATPAPAPTLSVAPGEEPTVPSGLLRDRAMQLLGEGDIAAARMVLLHLAERGDGEAAYDLARTFDREMLAELGAKGVGGDAASARGWYERASQDGNEKAAERLKVLASLSGANPSD